MRPEQVETFERAAHKLGLTDDENIGVHWIDMKFQQIRPERLFWSGCKFQSRLAVLTYLIANDFITDTRARISRRGGFRNITMDRVSRAFGISELAVRSNFRRLINHKKVFALYRDLNADYWGRVSDIRLSQLLRHRHLGPESPTG